MKKEQRQKILLLIIIGAGAIYAYSMYLLLPEWAKIQTLQQSVRQKQEDYRQLQFFAGNRTTLQSEIDQLQSKLSQGNVLKAIDKPQIMLYLYKTAKSHGVNPQSVEFEDVQQKGNYQEMSLSLTCQGNPQNIFRFITDLKNGTEQRLVPQSVNLTLQQGVMRGDLKFTAYGAP